MPYGGLLGKLPESFDGSTPGTFLRSVDSKMLEKDTTRLKMQSRSTKRGQLLLDTAWSMRLHKDATQNQLSGFVC